jgi:endo-1,4-beta-xylanase
MPRPASLIPAAITFIRRIGLFAFLCFACATLASQRASAQSVSSTFEDGTTQGWGPRGPVTLTVTSEASHSGTMSLKTTGRTAGWNGPAISLLTAIPVNATYQVSGWVRLVAGQPASNLKFTLERTPSGGSTTYAQINAPVATTDSAWVLLSGTMTLPADTNTGCTLYVESDDPTSQYYLDDFSITALSAASCPEPLDQSGIATNFEDGGNDGWSSRGSAVLTNVVAPAISGTHVLSVTNRGASWQGSSINALCKLHKGSKYLISAWVRLQPGEAACNLRVSLQASLAGVTNYYTVVGNTPVTDGAWVNLETEYTFGLDVDQLQLYIESDTGTSSYYLDDFQVTYLPPIPIQTDIPSLKDVLAPYFPIGTAIEPEQLSGEHQDLLLKHFSQFTAGNAMKWDATEPTEGHFNFTRADQLANFARAHGLRMRGHTMIWHSQVPAWVFQDADGNPLQPGNSAHRALLLARMQNHIHTVISRYADIVDSWDVVNEVIDESQPDGLRTSPWRQIIGPDYIDYAFQYASEVANGAALFINDYNTYIPAKRAALQSVVQGLINRHVPVNGVGHQMHVSITYPAISDVKQTLELFAGMGMMNEVTEMDMSVYTDSTTTTEPDPQSLITQGYRYRDFFNLFRQEKDIINSVTVWGLSDDTSWLKTFPITRDDKPLFFDETLQAKPAYWGVVDPSRLPIIPQKLNVTHVNSWFVGTLEPFWLSIAPQPLTSATTQGSWAQFRAVWKGDKIYVYAEVTEPSIKTGDAIDFYVGTQHYKFNKIGASVVNGAQGISLPVKGGYALFAILPAGQTLAVGNTLPFDIRATSVSLNQQISWSDTHNQQDASASGLGTLAMISDKQVSSAIHGTPVIDGNEDKIWKLASAVQTKTFVLGTSGATARVRTMWDSGHIYVYAEVTDPLLSQASANAWEQDSVEIFIDANNAQTTTYQSDDAQYRVNFANVQSFGGAASASKIQSATRITPTGYVVEAAIAVDGLPASTKGLIPQAKFIGFDVQVNDDATGSGTRTSVATWNDTVGNDYMDTSHFGALQLAP